ncbi:MAG TPA: FAA hydrolase family protein [Anaerolineae bacterium]|nr:FAA hydrolase family protein [Anaerolineae bacterium]HIQ04099.1 FAA hydrolase family protein [Anaerolineae bacterium]
MRYIRYRHADKIKLGMTTGGRVVELPPGLDFAGDMRAFIAAGSSAQDAAQQAWRMGHTPNYLLSEIELLAPIDNPTKVIAIGLNYMDHCREQNVSPPKHPIIFAKFPSAIVGPGATITWDPALTSQVDFEAELAVVIGREARHISAADAMNYVFGYTCANDVSARDLQFGDRQWVRGKSLDSFCPLGPWIVTADEISDPHNLAIRSRVNGTVMQESNTGEMIFNIPTLIEFCSQAFTLYPGDVILTGTPHGVGVFREPQVFLQHGDEVVIEIEGIGELRNRCARA